MKTIIAPTDFSPISLNAVNYAADLAAGINANLTLLHVYNVPVTVGYIPSVPAFANEIEEDVTKKITDLKEEILARLHERIIVHTEVQSGDIINGIKECCEWFKPYAVVMGAEGTGSLDRFFLGARSLGAMEEMRWPLIIVPPGVHFKPIKKIGLACDFRDVKSSVHAEAIRSIVEDFSAELVVLHVVAGEPGSPAAFETEREIGCLREMLGDTYFKLRSFAVPHIEEGIMDFAGENKLDLLIMVPKNHGFISRVFGHSHSKRVALHSSIPVMAIHEQMQRQAK